MVMKMKKLKGESRKIVKRDRREQRRLKYALREESMKAR